MILVTGATGLLGSHLIYSLVKNGEKVRATKRSISNLDEVKRIFSFYTDKPESIFEQIDWTDADLLYPESLPPLFEGITKVYNVAASISFDPRDRKRIINTNREITANIVNTCLLIGNIRLLQVSSTSALGASQNKEPVNEEVMWTPDKKNSAYSISKFLSEMEVWRGFEEGMEGVIVNPSIILGPGFWDRGSASLFTNIRKGLKYYTNGVTGYVGVEDVVKSMITVMDSKINHERFIINSQNLSYKEVFRMIANELNVKPPNEEATAFLAGLAWRMDAIRSLTGAKRVITRETVHAGFNTVVFSNDKIRNATGIEFEEIKKVIHRTAGFYIEYLK